MKLYKPNQKLCDMNFEELFFKMKPRIEFHCNRVRGLIPGYTCDDIFQELSIKLWKVSVPNDIKYYDWRYLRYMDRVFRNHIHNISRKYIDYKTKKSIDIIKNSMQFTEKRGQGIDSFNDTYAQKRYGHLYQRLLELLN